MGKHRSLISIILLAIISVSCFVMCTGRQATYAPGRVLYRTAKDQLNAAKDYDRPAFSIQKNLKGVGAGVNYRNVDYNQPSTFNNKAFTSYDLGNNAVSFVRNRAYTVNDSPYASQYQRAKANAAKAYQSPSDTVGTYTKPYTDKARTVAATNLEATKNITFTAPTVSTKPISNTDPKPVGSFTPVVAKNNTAEGLEDAKNEASKEVADTLEKHLEASAGSKQKNPNFTSDEDRNAAVAGHVLVVAPDTADTKCNCTAAAQEAATAGPLQFFEEDSEERKYTGNFPWWLLPFIILGIILIGKLLKIKYPYWK